MSGPAVLEDRLTATEGCDEDLGEAEVRSVLDALRQEGRSFVQEASASGELSDLLNQGTAAKAPGHWQTVVRSLESLDGLLEESLQGERGAQDEDQTTCMCDQQRCIAEAQKCLTERVLPKLRAWSDKFAEKEGERATSEAPKTPDVVEPLGTSTTSVAELSTCCDGDEARTPCDDAGDEAGLLENRLPPELKEHVLAAAANQDSKGLWDLLFSKYEQVKGLETRLQRTQRNISHLTVLVSKEVPTSRTRAGLGGGLRRENVLRDSSTARRDASKGKGSRSTRSTSGSSSSAAPRVSHSAAMAPRHIPGTKVGSFANSRKNPAAASSTSPLRKGQTGRAASPSTQAQPVETEVDRAKKRLEIEKTLLEPLLMQLEEAREETKIIEAIVARMAPRPKVPEPKSQSVPGVEQKKLQTKKAPTQAPDANNSCHNSPTKRSPENGEDSGTDTPVLASPVPASPAATATLDERPTSRLNSRSPSTSSFVPLPGVARQDSGGSAPEVVQTFSHDAIGSEVHLVGSKFVKPRKAPEVVQNFTHQEVGSEVSSASSVVSNTLSGTRFSGSLERRNSRERFGNGQVSRQESATSALSPQGSELSLQVQEVLGDGREEEHSNSVRLVQEHKEEKDEAGAQLRQVIGKIEELISPPMQPMTQSSSMPQIPPAGPSPTPHSTTRSLGLTTSGIQSSPRLHNQGPSSTASATSQPYGSNQTPTQSLAAPNSPRNEREREPAQSPRVASGRQDSWTPQSFHGQNFPTRNSLGSHNPTQSGLGSQAQPFGVQSARGSQGSQSSMARHGSMQGSVQSSMQGSMHNLGGRQHPGGYAGAHGHTQRMGGHGHQSQMYGQRPW